MLSIAEVMKEPRVMLPIQWQKVADREGGLLVGGCLRDTLLGRPVKDVDIFVPGLTRRSAKMKASTTMATYWCGSSTKMAGITRSSSIAMPGMTPSTS